MTREVALLREVLNERLSKRVDICFTDPKFKAQTDFIEDKAKMKAVFCTRRSGKSYGAGAYLFQEAYQNPGVSCLYIALTRDSAKKIMWKDVLKTINRKLNLEAKFNETLLTATLPNGSVIYLMGVDSNEQEKEKLLGQKYKLVVIDEAASFSIDMKHLIYGILKPAMVDLDGTVCLIGTPSNITKGLFYDITNSKELNWSLHKWSALDNPYIRERWIEEIEEIKRNTPLMLETPLFKQHYLGEWVVDTDKLVYKFNEARNLYHALPRYRTGSWSHVLGVDLGYHPDPSAFVLTTFHEHDPTLYITETFKKTEMDVTDVANKIKEYQSKFDIYKVIIDGANKQAVEEIQRRHGIALHAADKTGKSDFIEIMNAELIQGKIKIHSGASMDLAEEYKSLVWVTEGESIAIPRKEHPNLSNHLCDGALYAWRFCYPFLSTKEKVPVDLKTQWIQHTQKLMEDHLEKQIQKEQTEENQNDIWNMAEMDPDSSPLDYYLNKRKRA